MNRLRLSLIIMTTILVQGAFAQCTDLFFSEYIEGSSNNKAIEIYNPSNTNIDLSNYTIKRFNNGGTSPSGTYNFTGIIASKAVFVIGNSGADNNILNVSDTLSALTFYNGDDALILVNDLTGDTIDVIGQLGVDPGSNWTVGTGATSEFTLVRKFTILQGQKDWTIGATEWDVFPQNTFDSLGEHSATSCPVSALSVSITQNNVSCFGGSDGSLTAVESGGASPYTYLWSTGASSATITGLFAGTYTTTITDNGGVTATSSATITEPIFLSSTTTSTQNVSCNGTSDGAINISVFGGITPYTYLWSNGDTAASSTGLAAGVYTLTITDANGCNNTSTTTISEPTALVSSAVVDSNVTINGGTDGGATASGIGGISPYTYSWSNAATTASITGVNAGTYSVTITDNNSCTDSASIIITQPTSILVSINVISDVSCNGFSDGSMSVSASGGTTPYTYSWSNGVTSTSNTGLIAGSYTITVTDNSGSTSSSSALISEPTALVSSAVVDSNVTANGGADGGATASAIGGTSAYTFAWSNGATTASITGVTAGTYSVTISDANACTDSSSVMISEPLAIILNGIVTHVSCNAADDGSIDVTVTNGSAPYTYLWSNGDTLQNVDSLVAGTYSVTVTDASSITATQSYTITEPITINISVLVDSNATCNGMANGGLTATATGGFGNLSYFWNTDNKALAAQSFESLATDTWSYIESPSRYNTEGDSIVAGSDDIWAVIEEFTGNIDTSSNGSYFWGVQDIDNSNGGGAFYHTLTFTPFDVSTETGVKVAFDFYTVGFDGTDELEYEVIFDNGTTWSTIGTALNKNSSAWNTIEVNVPDTASFVRLRLQAKQNGGSDYAAFDNIRILSSSNSITGITAGSYAVIVTDANGCTASSTGSVSEPLALTNNTVVTNSSAIGVMDGAIDLTVSGGTPSYTYSWSNGVVTEDNLNIASGTYTVTITDANGCTIVDSATVQDPAVVFVNLDSTRVSCNGLSDGSATATATGGTTPFTYLWSPSSVTGQGTNVITGLTAGNYYVTVTDAVGTSVVDSIMVTEPDALAISLAITNASATGASDGSISSTVIGGTSPYSYNWGGGISSPSILNVLAGNYCVTVTDANGCNTVACGNVLEPGVLAQLVISEINYNGPESGTDTSEFIEFVNTGMNTVKLNGYSFVEGVTHTFGIDDSITAGQYYVIAYDSSAFRNRYGINADAVWNSGGLSNGGEDITIVDNFGRTIDSVDYESSSPWPSGSGVGQPAGGGSSIELNDTLSDNNLGVNWIASINPIAGVSVNGNPVYGTPGSKALLVGIENNELVKNDFSIYPNPSNGLITIITKATEKNTRVQIISIKGKVLRDEILSRSIVKMDVSNFSNGIYMIKIGEKIQKMILNK